jgi:hypothetical protein
MPNSHRVNTIMSTSPTNGKNSLTFESVVCSQLELKRHAASFSRRRSTMCRRPSQYIAATSNRSVPSPGISSTSPSNARTSISITPDISTQFLKTKQSNNESKRSRTSSRNSIGGVALENIGERQSLVSILYWDTSLKNATNKKV